MHQSPPICSKLYQVAPNCTNLHKVAPGYNKGQQTPPTTPTGTKPHESAPSCTNLHQDVVVTVVVVNVDILIIGYLSSHHAIRVDYKVRQLILVQSATSVITKYDSAMYC